MKLFKNDRKKCFGYLFLILQLSAQYSKTTTALLHPPSVSLKLKKISDGAKRIVVKSVKCTHLVPHTNIVELFDCQLNRRNNRSYISGVMSLRQPIARLEANVFYRSSGQLKNMFNITFDCCAISASGRHSIKLFESLAQILFSKFNVIPKCPMKANFNYTCTDLDLSAYVLPVYVASRSFYAGLNFRHQGLIIGKATVEGKVITSNLKLTEI